MSIGNWSVIIEARWQLAIGGTISRMVGSPVFVLYFAIWTFYIAPKGVIR